MDSGKRKRIRILGKILFILYVIFIVYFLLFSDWYGRLDFSSRWEAGREVLLQRHITALY